MIGSCQVKQILSLMIAKASPSTDSLIHVYIAEYLVLLKAAQSRNSIFAYRRIHKRWQGLKMVEAVQLR